MMSPEQRIRVLESELRVAYGELAKLRRRLNESGSHGKRVDRAYRDALLLAELAIGYQPTTRAFAEKYAGITHVRWENAMALLRLARVHSGKKWLLHDLAAIEKKLSAAVEKAHETPEAFRARLPKHARGSG
ncbi:MAG: hypothetical protein R3C14_28690 [Caldilineaceae bacterium]